MRRVQPAGKWACGGAVFVSLLLLIGACSPAAGLPLKAQASPSGTVSSSSYAGGCSGTAVTDAYPPVWAQSGWHVAGGHWPVPWALGSPTNGVAYLFATELVAGPSPRSDGTNNKVLWVIKGSSSFVVQGHPLGSAQPAVSEPGGPSIIDVPSAGCWTFDLVTKPDDRIVSTINLEALPAGMVPARAG